MSRKHAQHSTLPVNTVHSSSHCTHIARLCLTQIASYILFLFFVVTFYTLFVLYPGLGGRIAAGLIFGLGAVATLICAGFATATNPADKNIYVANPRSARDLMPGHLYCYRCERHVLDTSKHCTICHKCVDVFDHHCIWLNNCVGRHNYMAFLALLLSAATMLVVQVAIGIYILVDYASDKAALDLYVRNSLYSGLSGTAYFAVTIIITILCLTAFGLVGQLLSFHCYLSECMCAPLLALLRKLGAAACVPARASWLLCNVAAWAAAADQSL